MSMFVREAPVEEAVEDEIVKLVQRDVVGLRALPNDGDVGANNMHSLLHQTSLSAVEEIDHLIDELQISRERLYVEGERVERKIAEYASLNQSVLQATKLIAERLCQLNRVPDAPSIADDEA